MEPRIRRSMTQGFRTAARGWMGIVVVFFSWIIVMFIVTGLIALTHPPERALQRSRTETQPPPPATTTPGQSASESSSPPTNVDLFGQMTTEQTSARTKTAPNVQMQSAGPSRAERQRMMNQWIRKAWPVILICVVSLSIFSLWMTGGQIGYLGQGIKTGRLSLLELWTYGIRSLGRLFIVSAISLGAMLVLLLIGSLVSWLFSRVAGALPSWLSGVLGLLVLCVVLAALVWLAIRLAFWFIAVVLDGAGPIDGVTVSFRISRGFWWRICGLLLVLMAISFGVLLIVRLFEMLAQTIGGVGGMVLGFLAGLLNSAVNLYLTFAMTAALIQFYVDAQSSLGVSGESTS